MKLFVLLLTVLMIVAVAAIGAKDIFRQPAVAPEISDEQNRALQDALKNGILSEGDYQQATKRAVLLVERSEAKLKEKNDVTANPPQR